MAQDPNAYFQRPGPFTNVIRPVSPFYQPVSQQVFYPVCYQSNPDMSRRVFIPNAVAALVAVLGTIGAGIGVAAAILASSGNPSPVQGPSQIPTYNPLYGFDGLLKSIPPTAYISLPPTPEADWVNPLKRNYLCGIGLTSHPEIRSRIPSHVNGEVVRIDGRVHELNGRLQSEFRYGKRLEPDDLAPENVDKAELPGIFGFQELYLFSTDNTNKPIEFIKEGLGSQLL
jgi:hypothetical protein